MKNCRSLASGNHSSARQKSGHRGTYAPPFFWILAAVGFLFCAGAVHGQRNPLYKAFLQTNLDGNGMAITNLGSITVSNINTPQSLSFSSMQVTDKFTNNVLMEGYPPWVASDKALTNPPLVSLNMFFAGPVEGVDTYPIFRAIESSDIPPLAYILSQDGYATNLHVADLLDFGAGNTLEASDSVAMKGSWAVHSTLGSLTVPIPTQDYYVANRLYVDNTVTNARVLFDPGVIRTNNGRVTLVVDPPVTNLHAYGTSYLGTNWALFDIGRGLVVSNLTTASYLVLGTNTILGGSFLSLNTDRVLGSTNNSEALRATLIDETGTGGAVFSNAPTIYGANLVAPSLINVVLPGQSTVSGDVAFVASTNSGIANGINYGVSTGTNANLVMSGNTAAADIYGFDGGRDGRWFFVYNASTNNHIFYHDQGDPSTNNRFLTPNTAPFTNPPGGEFIAKWMASSNRFKVLPFGAASIGSGEVNTVASAANNGASVVADVAKVGTVLQLRSIVAGTGIDVTTNGTNITIAVSSGGGGGGAQSPWTNDVDGDGYSLTNVLNVSGGGTPTTAARLNGVKIFRALLTQTGTSAPTATVLENSLGAPTWGYVGTGEYTLTITGAFTANKTFPKGAIISLAGATAMESVRTDANTITIFAGGIGAPADDTLNGTPLEILVYP